MRWSNPIKKQYTGEQHTDAYHWRCPSVPTRYVQQISTLISTFIVVMTFWVFETICVLRMHAPRGNGSPERQRISRGCATAPRPPHIAPQGVIGERSGANAELGKRGAWKGAPGDGLLDPVSAGDHKNTDIPIRNSNKTAVHVHKGIRVLLYLSLIHISEPTRQAEISYAVFCLKKKN